MAKRNTIHNNLNISKVGVTIVPSSESTDIGSKKAKYTLFWKSTPIIILFYGIRTLRGKCLTGLFIIPPLLILIEYLASTKNKSVPFVYTNAYPYIVGILVIIMALTLYLLYEEGEREYSRRYFFETGHKS